MPTSPACTSTSYVLRLDTVRVKKIRCIRRALSEAEERLRGEAAKTRKWTCGSIRPLCFAGALEALATLKAGCVDQMENVDFRHLKWLGHHHLSQTRNVAQVRDAWDRGLLGIEQSKGSKGAPLGIEP